MFSLIPTLSWNQSIKCFIEQDYYTNERDAGLVMVVPNSLAGETAYLDIEGKYARANLQTDLEAGPNILRLGIRNLPDTTHLLNIRVQVGNQNFLFQTILKKLPHRKNAVKINRLRGGLIVDQLPWFPFGFYCYSPVQPTLAEEEVGRGFNLFSPYQKIETATLSDRLAYLDRCAALGMKVHYNLLSVAGGGGVGNGRSNYSQEERLQLMEQEILAVKDHPAILAWYISDEPTGRGVLPTVLLPYYQAIKRLDPYHPVSIVFLNAEAAQQFEEVTDIVMADPYPIPNQAPQIVGELTEDLIAHFRYKKPVWLVPQAFGGNEWWAREPSPGELRLMTYLPIIEGATGIQYFVRHGLSAFPKSTLSWDAASAVAKETSEMLPFLLEYELSAMVPQVDSSLKVRWYQHNGQLLILVVNTEKGPKSYRVDLQQDALTGTMEVLFEQRVQAIAKGLFQDVIEGYGRRAYLLQLQPSNYRASIQPQNLLLDPSFEDSPVAGTPAACYTKIQDDRGATATLDTRTQVHGRHSLKLVAPAKGQSMAVSLFPVRLNGGQAYALSFWARSLQDSLSMLIQVGNLLEERLQISPFWKEYQLFFQMPAGDQINPRASVRFLLEDQGMAWFDLFQLLPEPKLVYSDDIFSKQQTVSIQSAQLKDPSISIHYTLDGSPPNITAPPYNGPINITETSMVQACVINAQQQFCSKAQVFVNAIKADKVIYNSPSHAKYKGNGQDALIDGVLASSRFTDGLWQGWNKDEVDLLMDFGKPIPMQKLYARFLRDHTAWIYLPQRMHVFASTDGLRFKKLATHNFPLAMYNGEAEIQQTPIPLDGGSYRYLRILAERLKALPEDHPSSGGNPFVFMDEVIVEGRN